MCSPLVSIIVVTHNSEKYISKCINSILKLSYPHSEVIVVDCASGDGTLKQLRRWQRRIKIIEVGANLGFAAGNNLGFTRAKGKYLLLLNPDTEITKEALDLLVEVMEADSKIAAAQPSVFLYKQRKVLNLTGKEVHFLGFDWIRDYRRKQPPPIGEIFSISGAAVLLRARTLKRIGLFDASYFMYFEDSDLSWRIRLYGEKMWYVAEAVVYHDYKYHLQSEQAMQRKIRYYERNRMITVLKNYETKTLLLLLPVILLTEAGLLMLSLAQGWFMVKIRAEAEVVRELGSILKGREELKRLRKRTDHQLVPGFVSTVSFMYFDHPLVRIIANPVFDGYWRLVRPLI